jgi:acyl dehydratase
MKVADPEALLQAALAEGQSLIGAEVDRTRQRWNTVVTRDAIRHFCWAIGDDNPLWLDESYARNSAVGALTAPGTFLFTVDSLAIFPGLIGWRSLGLGQSCKWYRRVYEGEAYNCEAAYTDCQVVRRQNGRAMIVQTGSGAYRNQAGQLVASMEHTAARLNPAEQKGPRYAPRRHSYSADELEDLRARSVAETVRGAEDRYWEDTNEGDALGPIIKGPLSLTDMICWYAGGGANGRRAHRIMFKETTNNPEHWTEPDDGHPAEHVGQGHLETAVAESMGMPGPYDNVNQRTSWLGHLITDWMGDSGFLKELTCQLRRPNVFGDTQFLTGSVTKKHVDPAGDPLVSLALSGTNQLGELTTVGTAVVRLPARPG